MKMADPRYGLTIVGGGPAGLAPLLAAHRVGQLDAVLDNGVAIVERSATIGAGSIGGYGINSDSSGQTFVDCLKSTQTTELTELASHPLAIELEAAGQGAVPLAAVGVFMELVGGVLHRMIARHPNCAVFTQHEALAAQQGVGGWLVKLRDRNGRIRHLRSAAVIIATGAHQPAARLEAELVGGVSLKQHCGGRLIQSGDVLATGGVGYVAERLAGLAAPRVAIVGGSTSAAAVAHALLHRMPGVRFPDGGITLLHRRPLRIYYPSAAEAEAEGYTEFGPDDICPISHRVFRFAGFRLDSRELIMQARGIGGRPPEPRLRLHRLGHDDSATQAVLDGADLVIAALGYRPHTLPVFDMAGRRIPLFAQSGPQNPFVDARCRVLDAAETPLPGLFGIGLAAGFVPRGALGGEPSFSGQANGLWLWQNDVGRLITDALLVPSREMCSVPDLPIDLAAGAAACDIATGTAARPPRPHRAFTYAGQEH